MHYLGYCSTKISYLHIIILVCIRRWIRHYVLPDMDYPFIQYISFGSQNLLLSLIRSWWNRMNHDKTGVYINISLLQFAHKYDVYTLLANWHELSNHQSRIISTIADGATGVFVKQPYLEIKHRNWFTHTHRHSSFCSGQFIIHSQFSNTQLNYI